VLSFGVSLDAEPNPEPDPELTNAAFHVEYVEGTIVSTVEAGVGFAAAVAPGVDVSEVAASMVWAGSVAVVK
jgi:hypothetical protein